jgi:mannose-6-phosphate isomerase-like protein (cupin superfamily)
MGVRSQDIAAIARENEAFRREVVTGEHSQVVVMTIPPGGEIGEEVHDHVDQTLFFIEGTGQAVLEGDRSPIGPTDVVFVRGGTRHNFLNTGGGPLRLATVYAPPEHEPGTIHATKEEADRAERHSKT